MFKLMFFTILLHLYTCVYKYFMLIVNALSEVDQIQRIIDMISGRNKNRGSNILDLPPELLDIVFGLLDFQCKKNCRLVHNYLRAVIDHNFMKFKFQTRDEKSVHALEKLEASQQYFEKVKISFRWGRPCQIVPASIQPDYPFPQIKKAVFSGNGYGPVKSAMEDFEILAQGSPPIFPTPSLLQLRELLMFILQRVCGRTEYLRIDLKYLTLTVLEMKPTLSNVTWNSLQKLRFCTATHGNSCIFGIMKSAKIPILSEFEIDILPSILSTSSQQEEEDELRAFIVGMCHFLLDHKETLRTVKCRIETRCKQHKFSGHPDFTEELEFIQGQLKLEHCQVRMSEHFRRIDFGFVAIALIKGSSSLRSFELAKDYEDDELHGYSNDKLQKDLEEVLRKNGSTLEKLSLGYVKIDSNSLKYCTKLDSLEFGLSEELFHGEHNLYLGSVQEFTFGFYVIFKEFANWAVNHMPNLKVITLKQCEIETDALDILLKLKFLREFKIQRVDVDMDLESYCNRTAGLTYKMHENPVRDYTKRQFGYLRGLTYSASIYIDRST